MSADPRIDAYIAKAQPFARPILEHVRKRIHAAVPEVEESIKWSAPAFLLDGRILLMMACFKQHMALNFWRGQELRGGAASDEAMGQFGRITAMADLPGDAELERLIREAADLSRSAPAPRKAKAAPKPAAELHADFAAALDGDEAAKAAFEAFPPGCRREYADWIAEAKREETRARRIATAMGNLREGKKLHWKYEGC
ncbi:YdeI/OmpD-associated family protein [Sphingomonas humi]|uniref:YdhG-like domain-containing protein n=1 Tax=Sphingomonas humi TaxID=335630 RepID=A0ABP7RQN0_9SPHN